LNAMNELKREKGGAAKSKEIIAASDLLNMEKLCSIAKLGDFRERSYSKKCWF